MISNSCIGHSPPLPSVLIKKRRSTWYQAPIPGGTKGGVDLCFSNPGPQAVMLQYGGGGYSSGSTVCFCT